MWFKIGFCHCESNIVFEKCEKLGEKINCIINDNNASDDEIEISSLFVGTRGSLRGFGIITISIISASIHLFARVYSKWQWWSALLPFFHCIYTAIVVHTTHFQRCDKCDYQQFHLASSIILDLILNDITFYKIDVSVDNFVYVFIVVATPRLGRVNFITLVHAHTHFIWN